MSRLRLNRRRFLSTTAVATVASAAARPAFAAAAEEVRVGVVGAGGRGGEMARAFAATPGVRIVMVADPDQGRARALANKYQATAVTDLRRVFDNDDIDAVVVATCNHWHCLASIWALDAGKHVYVEKPLSHTQWEGQQLVAAAKNSGLVCGIGTQQRSDPMQAEVKQYLHKEKALGDIQYVQANRLGPRASIGRNSSPLKPPAEVDYSLWLGPAADQPIYRNNLHYDWHWDFNTGSGEMGNWGVHVLDDVRNNVFQDKVTLPKKIFGGGGRIVYNDAGETPNVHFVYFDTGSIPVVIGLSNLPDKPGSKKAAPHPGPGSGYIAYCEGGRFEGQRGNGVAFDNDGKVVRNFGKSANAKTTGDGLHQKNFIEAVRNNDATMLNAEVERGHHSTGWCNLANIAFQAGKQFSMDQAREVGLDRWQELIDQMQAHTMAHGLKLESDQIRLSPILEMDPATEQFVGDNAAAANQFLKRKYREGYEVPDLAQATSSK